MRDVTPPSSAADKAGLLGGDLITSFDGKSVKSENELSSLLSNTPIGKTVDVTFIRDGETKTVKLTTVSESDNDNLREAFENMPKGFLGVDDNFQLACSGFSFAVPASRGRAAPARCTSRRRAHGDAGVLFPDGRRRLSSA